MTRLTEVEVFNATRSYFISNDCQIIQLVAPGGQAPVCLSFNDGTKPRTCFPDLLAIAYNVLWVGELKSTYSEADYAKVKLMLSHGKDELRRRLTEWVGSHKAEQVVICGVLCHSDSSATRKPNVHQLIFGPHGWVAHLPPLDD